ncbi:juvenile hormone esterase-like [Battus philenor]|uniref:juvenile hormone esterase-like n=1 Tax=Battus philenor TaxID=42288 RepID=UPI0035CEC73D
MAVYLPQGKLKGKTSRNDNGFEYIEFLGIPYAKPPVGELRFKSPQPAEPWEGERDATTINKNNICLQNNMLSGQLEGSEDCLYLNVYTPKIPDGKSELLPVMVFIHGGGFVCGAGIVTDENGPDYLIEHNVILVTINYRLSVFGFLSLDIPEASGNMGLKDQVTALQWIQNYIKYFGGDKDNVTIFGISAGGASVEYLTISPKAKGLFHKAIMHSGSSLNHWAINYEPKKLINKLVENLGYEGSLDDNFALYEFLLNTEGAALTASSFKVCDEFTSNRLFFGFVPTIEKDFGNGEAFITDHPYRLLKQGNFNHVSVIKGFCNKEGYLLNLVRPNTVLNVLEKKNFTDHWPFDLDSDDKDLYRQQLLQAYSENVHPDDDHDKLVVDFFGDLDFVSGIWVAGQLMASHGTPVRFYEFSYDGKINFFKNVFGMCRKGAAHADDHTYVLCHQKAKDAYGQDLLIRNAMSKMWANFANTSSPTPENSSKNLPNWPVYTEKYPVYLNINNEIKIQNNYEPKRMSIFTKIFQKYEK